MPNPTFQEQIEALIVARLPEAQRAEVLAQLKPINDGITHTFKSYADDIAATKTRLQALEGIKPEDHAKLETLSKKQAEDLAALQNSVDEYKAKYATADKALVETQGELVEATREKEVRRALASAKLRIAEDSFDEVYLTIDKKVVQKKDGTFVVPSVIVSKDAAGTEIRTPTEYPIAEYLTKEWANTAFAKRVILADYSTGGGASGNGKGAGSAEGSKKFNEMTYGEKMALRTSNPTQFTALQAETALAANKE